MAEPTGLLPYVARAGLVDHHCHPVVREPLGPGREGRARFESLLTEADGAGPFGTTLFDTQVGLAVRRWCAPVLGLPAHAAPDEYLARRARLGDTEVSRRLLRVAGLAELYVDTGYATESLTTLDELAELSGATVGEVVRLEAEAELVAAGGVSAASFAGAVRGRLAARAAGAVGFKSIAAYRYGLGLPAARPGDAAVAAAAASLLAAAEAGGPVRLADPVLHGFLVWTAVDLGLPVQFHAGYGDRDLDLRRADPLLLTPLLRALDGTGVPIMLLHNYPYHRQAGYLAQVFPQVFVDVGLALHGVGVRAPAVLAEALELTPLSKFCFSSDAYGLPELYYLAALLFRRALSAFLAAGIADDAWSDGDAARIAELVMAGNARRAYGTAG